MDIHAMLKEKLENEMSEFKSSYRTMTVEQVYNDWYIIGFKEEFFEMLMSDFTEKQFDDKEKAWLASFNKPLDALYNEWLGRDGYMSHDWMDMVDFVRCVYYEVKRQEKQDLYNDIKVLGINVVKDASDDYFNRFDYVTHVSHNPFVFSAKLPNHHDEEINKKFDSFFKEKLFVKSCDYGCDTYPKGVKREVSPGNVQTYQQPVWNFIEAVEQMFNCQCNYYDDVNGFEFVFEFGTEDNKGCYVFGAGNNGQEFCQSLYFNNPDQIRDASFVEALTTIDKALFVLLEEHELCVIDKSQEVSLEDKIAEATEELNRDKGAGEAADKSKSKDVVR